MDFREMNYIVTVADCRSITVAAKKLYISQPSLSYIVSKVEQDIGVKLFDRKSYPLSLTYAGEKYVDTARKILLLNDNLRRELMDIGLGEKGKISFGIPTERAGYMLPRVLPKFWTMFPLVDVRIQELNSDELLQAIEKDEINFYILPRHGKDLPSGLTTELIYREPLYLIAAPDVITDEMLCGDGEKKWVDIKMVEHLPFIHIKKGHAIRKRTDDVLKRARSSPETVMEVSSCISALQLAASGLGITIVPKRVPDALGGVERFCCYSYGEMPDCWDVNVVYKKEVYLNRAERGFIEVMKEVFA